MLTQKEQKKAAKKFAKKWEGKGYEKGQSQPFWLGLLHEVYGVEDPTQYIIFEDKVILDHTSFIDGHIPSTHVLIEQKSVDKDLNSAIRQSDGSFLSPFQQAKRYSADLPYSERPRWIVTCNFKEFYIYDMERPNGEPEIVKLKDLGTDYYRLNFLVDQKDDHIQKQLEVSIQAGELVGLLYDALLDEYNNPEDEKTLRDLNILCVRIVFCLYAEDAGLFGRKGMFHDYLAKYRDTNAGFRNALKILFQVLDQNEEERDPYMDRDLLEFPYVNGGLFAKEKLEIPRMNEEIIDIILNRASLNFDWSTISPTIFGAVFESTLNPEKRRSGGMHYTSIENIHKVIDPLFLDDLYREFNEIMGYTYKTPRDRKLLELQDKMSKLKFLDPACGSGNFLTETYLSLRRLENKILKAVRDVQIVMVEVDNPIKVSISQFYGIEINDFAVTVARTALWIAESQMIQETEELLHINIDFLPLSSYPNIIEGNALTMDWKEVVSKEELNYIMGNPPFIGGMLMTKEQTDELKKLVGNVKGVGEWDYVTGWYYKAANIMSKNPKIRTAFVSTNSICQGQSVITFWKDLIERKNIKISFAHQSFVWLSEAKDKAAVHCVIIGIINSENESKNLLYTGSGHVKKVSNINAYLNEGSNVFITAVSKPISDVSKMRFGSMPRDGGNLIVSNKEREELIKKYPEIKNWIRPYIGAREFINRTNRWVLWLVDVPFYEIRRYPEIMKKVNAVREFRLSSKAKATQKFADTPAIFCQLAQPDQGYYIVVPSVSSERRRYIPIGYMDSNTIASNAVFLIPNATIYEFGILTSNVHMAWMRAVAGRLEMRYRYSKDIVYNTFPWPTTSDQKRKKIEETANNILKARNSYPKASYADLYDEIVMPKELREAHQANDAAVMEAYGFDWRNMSESECVAELMKMYERLTQK